MNDPRLEDHATGVELQLNELQERLVRARRLGDASEAADIDRQVADLIDDLASTAEAIAGSHFPRPVFHGPARHAA